MSQDQKVTEYLSRVASMQAAQDAERAAEQKAAQERDEEFRAEVLAFVLSKLPEEVHPYVSFHYYDEEEAQRVFLVKLPKCADIYVTCVAHIDAENGEKIIKLSDKGWGNTCFEVVRNEIGKDYARPLGEEYEREFVVKPVGEFSANKFDQAVQLALKIGPDYVDHMMIEAMNEELKAKAEEYERLPVCPLLSQGDSVRKCLGDRCALFIEWRSQDICALKTMGHAAVTIWGRE